jgi:hypothetical protein
MGIPWWSDPRVVIPGGMAALALIWNMFNTWLTHTLSRRRMTNEFRAGEFDTLVRAPITTALIELETCRAQIRAMLSKDDAAAIPAVAKDIQLSFLQPAYDKLDVAIGRAERLPDFSSQVHLREILSARWDEVLECLQVLYNSRGIRETFPAIESVCSKLQQLDSEVHAQLNAIARSILIDH